MKKNPYFKEAEFKCKCGKCKGLPAKMPPDELVDILCKIREHFNAPVRINSGYRCKAHNAKVGGAPASRHTFGDAADFVVAGVKTREVFEFVKAEFYDKSEHLGLAIKHNADEFKGFVHLDTWKKRTWTYK